MNDTVKRADGLRGAVNQAAGLVRNLYFTFLLLGTYVAIIIGSTTHLQLLEVSPVTLPILSVQLPIVGFYALISWLLLLFHFNVLLQLYLLSRRLHLFDAAVGAIPDPAAREEQKAQLFPFPFNFMLIGHEYGRLMRMLFAGIVWALTGVAPLHAEPLATGLLDLDSPEFKRQILAANAGGLKGPARPAAVPDIFGPGAVLNVGRIFMKVANNGFVGNPLTNISSDPSGQWPGASSIEYLFFIGLAVGAVNPSAVDPKAVRRVSYIQEWRPPTGPRRQRRR